MHVYAHIYVCLYCVQIKYNFQVLELIEAVEMVVRGNLHVSSVSAQSDKDHSKEILKEALHSRYILEQWEEIADNIPSKYEQYSIRSK